MSTRYIRAHVRDFFWDKATDIHKSAREEERGFFSKKYRFFSLRLLGKRKVRFRNLNNLRSQTVPVKKGQTSESPFSVVAFI